MDKTELRKADFKTGALLIAFCLWFMALTFAFMPFKETYGGVENVWYVSPWIFPAVVLTLLLILAVILTVNAVLCGGHRDVISFAGGQFRFSAIGTWMIIGLVILSAVGIWFFYVSVEDRIQYTIDESKWLAVKSNANIFSWSEPAAFIPMIGTTLVFLASSVVLAVSTARNRALGEGLIRIDGSSRINESNMRFLIIAVLFIELVYVLIPNTDFFIANLLFLSVFTVAFYMDTAVLIKRAMRVYLGIGVGVLAAYVAGFTDVPGEGISLVVDVAVLAVTLGFMVSVWRTVAANPETRRAFKLCMTISWITPLILTPLFRFGLLVPLPYEGIVVEYMHDARYFLKELGVIDAVYNLIGLVF